MSDKPIIRSDQPAAAGRQTLYRVSAALAGVLGYGFWRLLRAVQQVRRQPRLRPSFMVADAGSLQEQAQAIASANLHAGLEKRRLQTGEVKWVLCAGRRNFREPWARDFGFASNGLLALGERDIVRDGLEAFFQYQRLSGQFPVKLHSTSVVNRYLHSLFRREQPITAPLRPKYITAHNTISLDGNALLVIAALNYARHAGDPDFAAHHWARLKRAVAWLKPHATDDGLLSQHAYTDWADSIARTGRILYTNILYWKAVTDLAQTAVWLQREEEAEQLTADANRLQETIQDHFWDADRGYFVTSRRFHNLSSSGNLLAVAWGLADDEQAHAVLDNMARMEMASPVPTRVVSYDYPRRYVALENYLAGIRHYHTRAAWLWLGAWHVIALTRMQRREEAEALLRRLSQVIVQDGVVHEVYGADGRFLSTRWYTSEAPLTWNAGMVVYAHHIFCQAP